MVFIQYLESACQFEKQTLYKSLYRTGNLKTVFQISLKTRKFDLFQSKKNINWLYLPISGGSDFSDLGVVMTLFSGSWVTIS